MNRQQRRLTASKASKMVRLPWQPLEYVPVGPYHPLAPGGLRRSFRNNVVSVQVYEDVHACSLIGLVTPIGIRRHDGGDRVLWSDMQRIKDELFGSDRVAIQVFPATEDLVDEANMYWMWLLPEGVRFHFKLSQRTVAIAKAEDI